MTDLIKFDTKEERPNIIKLLVLAAAVAMLLLTCLPKVSKVSILYYVILTIRLLKKVLWL